MFKLVLCLKKYRKCIDLYMRAFELFSMEKRTEERM